MTLSLKDLLARAKASIEADSKLTEAKKAVKEARGKEELAQANAQAKKIQDSIDWQTTGIVLRIERWSCRCGRDGEAPGGLFLLYQHTRQPDWIRLASPGNESSYPPDLPRYLKVDHKIVTLCPGCGPEYAFTTPFSTKGKTNVGY